LYTQQAVKGVVDFASLLLEALPGLGQARNRRQLVPADAPNLKAVVALDGANAFTLLDEELTPYADALPPQPAPEQPLLIMYTSGTTSNPKGCIVPNRAILSNAWAIIESFNLGPDDVWWCPLPMFHIGGLLFVITMLAVGGLYSGVGYFDPAKAIEAIERTPPTVFYPLFPTITLPIIDHPRFAQLDHRKMRIMCNLAPESMQRRIQALVPHAPIIGAFGMTETCGTVCYGSPDDPDDKRYNTCGRPLPGWSLKIVDPNTHETLAHGERGEIAVCGVGLFDGYYNHPDLGRHLRDGYFLSGDVGSVDAQGRLSFHGRFKDQLKIGGENVAALEVESLLMTHPAVALAQVVGVSDEKYGEVVAAFIELKERATATERDIIDFCTNKIARFKVPRYVRFRTEWPMSATKIVKYRLREALESELFGSRSE
ncbi:MAG TPA: long-chain fatty acid--CoA ligase, partial [Paraburkholderia sp.]|uniref:class I adenylate-forming enzyme family protein n=1 Tax=Paraburkholderia sp. TaxID=1926495 RepID=UPI002B4598DD